MKVYVHFEGQSKPDFTYVAKVAEQKGGERNGVTLTLTVEDLLKEFVAAYNKKHGSSSRMAASSVQLLNPRRKPLPPSAAVSKLIPDKSDVYVVEREGATRDEGDDVAGTGGAASGRRNGGTAQPVQQEPATSARQPPEEPSEHSRVVKLALRKAYEAQRSGYYKDAAFIYREVLDLLPNNMICLRALASLALAVRDFAKAVPFLERAASALPTDIHFHARLGDAYAGVGDLDEALQQYDRALALATSQGLPPGHSAAAAARPRRAQPQPGGDPEDGLLPSGGGGSAEKSGFGAEPERDMVAGTVEEWSEAPGSLVGDLQGRLTLDEIKVKGAAVLYKLGHKRVAFMMVTEMLKENEYHVPALSEYGAMLLDDGQVEEALRVFLRILMTSKDHPGAQESLAKVLQHPEALELLKGELCRASSDASLAMMASAIKDYGAVDEAAALYREAFALAPGASGYALGLIHTLEVCNLVCEALLTVRRFLTTRSETALASLRLGDVLPLLSDLPLHEGRCGGPQSPRPHRPGVQGDFLRHHDLPTPPGGAPRGPPAGAALQDERDPMGGSLPPAARPPETAEEAGSAGAGRQPGAPGQSEGGERAPGEVRTTGGSGPTPTGAAEGPSPTASRDRQPGATGSDPAQSAVAEGPSSTASGDRQPGAAASAGAGQSGGSSLPPPPGAAECPPSGEKGPSSGPLVHYSVDALKALAVLYSLVKQLYLGGALARAGAVAECVQVARAASAVPMHHTVVRNEAAYFDCIYQLMGSHHPVGLPLPSEEEAPPLFLAGDSHCLAPAWRMVRLRGKPRLLTPLLVTGLKAWHLREDSNFYPKVSFHRVVSQSLPRGSQLIVLFGEIDCREGIITSVNKDKYKDLAEAIRATVGIFLAALTRLVAERHLEVFVHPVPPVLDATRPVVLRYNRELRRQVRRAAAEHPLGGKGGGGGRLHWLEFADDLLTPGSPGQLRPEFVLDGTHMTADYVALLARELAKVA